MAYDQAQSTGQYPSSFTTASANPSLDLGHLAKWAVSSHKYGFSVDRLRDGNDDTFWQ
jgi:hypothetical protein